MLSLLFFLSKEINLPNGMPSEFLHDYVPGYIAVTPRERFVSAAISISYKGEALYQDMYGYASRETWTPASNFTLYEWGNISKLLAHISIMQLKEQNKLELTDDIRKYTGNDIFKRLDANSKITILDLMNYNSGWDNVITDSYLKSGKYIEIETYLKVNEPKQVYKAGTRFLDSKYAIIVEAYIVEKVSGLPYIEYVQKNIFDKLNLVNISIDPRRTDISDAARENIASGYKYESKTILQIPNCSFGAYAAEGVISTLGDITKLVNNLVFNEQRQTKLFEKYETLEEMMTVSFRVTPDAPGIAHGLIEDFYLSRSAFNLHGETLGSSSTISIMPDLGFTCVIMTNMRAEIIINSGLLRYLWGLDKKPENSEKIDAITEGSFQSERFIHNGILYHFFREDSVELIRDGDSHISFNRDLYMHVNGSRYFYTKLGPALPYKTPYLILVNESGEAPYLYSPGNSYRYINNDSEFMIKFPIIILLSASVSNALFLCILIPGWVHVFRKRKNASFLTSVNKFCFITFILIVMNFYQGAGLYILDKHIDEFITHQLRNGIVQSFRCCLGFSIAFLVLELVLWIYPLIKSMRKKYLEMNIDSNALLSDYTDEISDRPDRSIFKVMADITIIFVYFGVIVIIGFSFKLQLYEY